MKLFLVLMAVVVFCSAGKTYAQTTEFTFQGSLKDNAAAANGSYDFEFAMFDMVTGGSQIGSTIPRNSVSVSNGIFTVKLDFGSVFPGADRYLEIRVRLAGQPDITSLSPRQLLNSAPYSVKSLNADNAATSANALQLGGVAASQYVITTDPRMTNARNPLPNSANYIWNQNAVLQTSSNFVISGNGFIGGTLEANVVDAATQYNIGGSRVLSVAGTDNVFAGAGAGTANTGTSNSFFGRSAGQANTTGNSNSFFGRSAGINNLVGGSNSFFGRDAGLSNTSGSNNSFFGTSAGRMNLTSGFNSFFGASAGRNNTAVYNSFFGANAGESNTTGDSNSFFGRAAGQFNTLGYSNSFFGRDAGQDNTDGFANSFFGADAGQANTTGDDNAFFGMDAGRANTVGFGNSFFGQGAGESNTSGYANSFFGRSAGVSNTIGNNNTIIGDNANVASGELTYATAIGAGSIVSTSDTIVIGRFLDDVRVPGNLAVTTLGAGGATALCRNASQQISTCSSSIRYKENIVPFYSGLELVRKLPPIAFDWKDGGIKDVGFAAEDVAKIDPRFVTYNSSGEVEGVKYDRLSVAFVNAFKEQQGQIEQQKEQIEAQKKQIELLTQALCSLKSDPEVCKSNR